VDGESNQSVLALSELGASLLALRSRLHFIDPALRALQRHASDADVRSALCDFILIQVHAFQEEWRVFEALGEHDPNVRSTCDKVKPALERISKWRGLSYVRNAFLAHTRDRRNPPLLVPGSSIFNDVPTNDAEQILLGECAVLAVAVSLALHFEAWQAGVAEIDRVRSVTPKTGICSADQLQDDLAAISRAVVGGDARLAALIDNIRMKPAPQSPP
jgi:hypothetical protein